MSNMKRISSFDKRFRSRQRFSTKFSENFNENENADVDIIDRNEENKTSVSDDFSDSHVDNNNSNIDNFDQSDSSNQNQKNSSRRDKEKRSIRNQIEKSTKSQEQDSRENKSDKLLNIDESIYNKSIYQMNAMTVLLIHNSFEDEDVFQNILKRENVVAAKALYQFMIEFKKRMYLKKAEILLNSNYRHFIDRDRAFFKNWLDKFRKESLAANIEKEFTRMSFKQRFFIQRRSSIEKPSSQRSSEKRNSTRDVIQRSLFNYAKRNTRFLFNAFSRETEREAHRSSNWRSLQQNDSFQDSQVVEDLVSRNENRLYVLEKREEINEKIVQVRDESLIHEEVLHSSWNRSKNNLNSEISYWKQRFYETVDSLLNARSKIRNRYDFHDEQEDFHDEQEYLSNSSRENDRNSKELNFRDRRNFDFENWRIENQNRQNQDFYRGSISQRNSDAIQDYRNRRNSDFKNQKDSNENRDHWDQDFYRDSNSSLNFRNSRDSDRDQNRFQYNYQSRKSNWNQFDHNQHNSRFETRNRNDQNFRFVSRDSRRLQTVNQKLNQDSYRSDFYCQDHYRSNYYRSDFYYRSRKRDSRRAYDRSAYNHLIYDRNLRSVKLRFADIMKFDSEENFVVFFIRRFYHIAEIEEEQVVLRILFMCLKKFALKWHISLSTVIRAEMNRDLKVWKNELLREYKSNKFEFPRQTETMKFCFDESLILSQYLSRKINLLHDVEIISENLMIQYLYNDLNHNLMLITFMKENDDILKNFERRVRQNEQTTKCIYETFRKTRYESKETTKTYQRDLYQKKKKNQSDLSAKKIQKLLNKLSVKKKKYTSWIKTKEKKTEIKLFKKIADEKKSRERLRFCQFCDKSHWNNECINKEVKKKYVKKILLNVTEDFDDENENIILNDENLNTYQVLRKIADSSLSSSKNDQ